MQDPDLPIFEIGLTLAGAISAGAFSAGVTDHLVRAMEAHNRRARAGGPDAPRHLVVLKAMSGASAGSVTLAAALAGLIDRRAGDPDSDLTPIQHRDYPTLSGDTGAYGISLPHLHDIWVDQLGLWHDADGSGTDGLLSLRDLKGQAGLPSLLDSTYIDRVADAALTDIKWDAARTAPYSFLAADLDLFLVTTSLTSVPYGVEFVTGGSNGDSFRMANHRAVRHFRVHRLGEHALPSPWLDAWSDEGIALCPPDDPDLRLFEDGLRAWDALKISAVASAAFPVGLSARMIPAEAEEFGRIDREQMADGGAHTLNIDPAKVKVALPDFGQDAGPRMAVHYAAVDGGVLNNEPFEYARFTIRGPSGDATRLLADNPRDPGEADRAVILIDPFPEGPEYQPDGDSAAPGPGVIGTLMGLFPALINQARFKPSEIVNAADPDIASRFIIRPSRERKDGSTITGKGAIASGSLDGFGGFMDHALRRHDFILGQRNCQRFLAENFCVTADNTHIGTPGATGRLPVIDPGPDFMAEIAAPAWPQLAFGRLQTLLEQGRRRLHAIGPHLLRDAGLSGVLLFLFSMAWRIRWPLHGFAKRIEHALIGRVMAELLSRGALSDLADLHPPERGILHHLLATPGRMATITTLEAVAVRDAEATPRQAAAAVRNLVDRGILWQSPRLLGAPWVGLTPDEPSITLKLLLFLRIVRTL